MFPNQAELSAAQRQTSLLSFSFFNKVDILM